jgi:general nucleoside transport system ATP-binding protein
MHEHNRNEDGQEEIKLSIPVLRTESICKSFSGVNANDQISIEIKRGEIHCLLGENGAGKSTLAKILYGEYQPDQGSIFVRGKQVRFSSPKDAIDMGIGMVHQHFVLAPPMTVLENVVVGTDFRNTNMRLAAERIIKLCEDYQVDIDISSPIRQLSVGQQQWVEILKALYLGIDILILDEPTAVLTPQESISLFNKLRAMAEEGLSIIFISHKLEEVMNNSDRITVLRRGAVSAQVNTRDVTIPKLAEMMVGRPIKLKLDKETIPPGAPLLEIKSLSTFGDERVVSLNNISLDVNAFEIVGLAGVAGNGQQELFDVISRVASQHQGNLLLNGENINSLGVKEVSRRGLAMIPPDRIKQALLMGFSVKDNLILGRHTEAPFFVPPMLRDKSIEAYANTQIEDYSIYTTGPNQMAKDLSGGNLQKIILARVLGENVKVVMASSPTRGLDVGAMEYVHNRLLELRKSGVGILLISEDLDEIFNLSDRIAVIFEGQLAGIFDSNKVSKSEIGLRMAGVTENEGHK